MAEYGQQKKRKHHHHHDIVDETSMKLCESMPVGLEFKQGEIELPSIYSEWKKLLEIATTSIDIAAYYFTLTKTDFDEGDGYADDGSWQGEDIYKRLLEAGTKRGIKIRIAQSEPSEGNPSTDSINLVNAGAAELRNLNFPALVGAGILHTKLWIVDNKHFYVGSANMDWRSLTQVKELGVAVYNNSTMAQDMSKIFDVYWLMGAEGASVPAKWPGSVATDINACNPKRLTFSPENQSGTLYLASSPPQFCPEGRTVDIDAILKVIDEADKFIDIAVMDYLPCLVYGDHSFWPRIDNALRKAAFERQVKVRMLCSWWSHSKKSSPDFLNSLRAFNPNIDTKLFKVPSTEEQSKIPFGRVNHNKYMVTDKTAYVGTSNWTADYFISTGGVGFVLNQSSSDSSDTIRQQLRRVFERDWNSEYTQSIPAQNLWLNPSKYGI